MAKQLIVNADDFGFSAGTNQGILECFSNGIVTSTSLMANGKAFENAAELAQRTPELPIGLHFSIIGERPVASPNKIPHLVDRNGFLPKTLSALLFLFAKGKLLEDEIKTECRAQLNRIVSAGIRPTHIDTHKHSIVLPPVLKAIVDVAAEFGILYIRNPFEDAVFRSISGERSRSNRASHWKQRLVSRLVQIRKAELHQIVQQYNLNVPEHFFGMSLTGLLDSKSLETFFRRLPEGLTEFMCHPGYSGDLAKAATRLKDEREQELRLLTNPHFKTLATQLEVEFTNYRKLKQNV